MCHETDVTIQQYYCFPKQLIGTKMDNKRTIKSVHVTNASLVV